MNISCICFYIYVCVYIFFKMCLIFCMCSKTTYRQQVEHEHIIIIFLIIYFCLNINNYKNYLMKGTIYINIFHWFLFSYCILSTMFDDGIVEYNYIKNKNKNITIVYIFVYFRSRGIFWIMRSNSKLFNVRK